MKKKRRRKNFVALYTIGLLVVIFLAIGVFLFFYKPVLSIYIYPENPKQGDTVFIKVKNASGDVIGNFQNKQLLFYQNEKSNDWIYFLGIDADQNPGDYNILLDIGGIKTTKQIKVVMADFSSGTTAVAPKPTQAGQTRQTVAESIVKNDNSIINKVINNFTPQPYFTAPFLSPLSSMKVSGFSFGKFIGFAQYKLQHFGVDLRAANKTKVFSINDGKVVLTANLPDYGKTVIIDHGLGIFSMYLHLDEFEVADGQMVERGQVIALSGESGYTTAPHLHFSIRAAGARVDPIVFIKTTKNLESNSFLASIGDALLNIFDLIK